MGEKKNLPKKKENALKRDLKRRGKEIE